MPTCDEIHVTESSPPAPGLFLSAQFGGWTHTRTGAHSPWCASVTITRIQRSHLVRLKLCPCRTLTPHAPPRSPWQPPFYFVSPREAVHGSGVTQHASWWVWLISVSALSSRLVRVAARVRISFLRGPNDNPPHAETTFCFSARPPPPPPADTGRFQPLGKMPPCACACAGRRLFQFPEFWGVFLDHRAAVFLSF